MRSGRRRAIAVLALAAIAACGPGFVGNAAADTAGTVHFVRSADTSFDPYTGSPSPEAQAWLRAHMWRMIAFSPYFDSKTSWYPQGWLYDDSYAIYKSSQLAAQHPEWILKDAAGNKLYIPFGCAGGTCPQYAGDISNPAYRHNWIAEARAELVHGYRGLFVDDVNMEQRTGNGEGQQVTPIDSTTGQAMSATAWRAYMSEFMAEIRAAFPSVEIVHNVIWFASSSAGTADPEHPSRGRIGQLHQPRARGQRRGTDRRQWAVVGERIVLLHRPGPRPRTWHRARRCGGRPARA